MPAPCLPCGRSLLGQERTCGRGAAGAGSLHPWALRARVPTGVVGGPRRVHTCAVPVLRARTAYFARAPGAVPRRPRPAAGETPLGLLLQSPACEASVPLLEGLVERGADTNMVTEGMTPLAQVSAQWPRERESDARPKCMHACTRSH